MPATVICLLQGAHEPDELHYGRGIDGSDGIALV